MGGALPFISFGLQLIGGIQEANAAEADTQAQIRQLEAQAAADRFNADIAAQNAEIVEGQTRAELEKADRERRLRLGANIASSGGSGVGMDSALDILQDNAAQEELNLLTIESEGLLRQREFTTQEELLRASASNTANQVPLVRSAGRSSRASSVISGVSSGISSGSRMNMF